VTNDIYAARSADDIYAHAENVEALRLCRVAVGEIRTLMQGERRDILVKRIGNAHRALGEALGLLGGAE
jgi:hypothetical protein